MPKRRNMHLARLIIPRQHKALPAIHVRRRKLRLHLFQDELAQEGIGILDVRIISSDND